MLLMDEVMPEASLPDFALQVAISTLKLHYTSLKYFMKLFICTCVANTNDL